MENEFERIHRKLDSVVERLTSLRIDVAKLSTEFKIKSGLWGFAAGAIPVLIFIIKKIWIG